MSSLFSSSPLDVGALEAVHAPTSREGSVSQRCVPRSEREAVRLHMPPTSQLRAHTFAVTRSASSASFSFSLSTLRADGVPTTAFESLFLVTGTIYLSRCPEGRAPRLRPPPRPRPSSSSRPSPSRMEWPRRSPCRLGGCRMGCSASLSVCVWSTSHRGAAGRPSPSVRVCACSVQCVKGTSCECAV
jgi:hypothetical protein